MTDQRDAKVAAKVATTTSKTIKYSIIIEVSLPMTAH
jgi:hypothetical protein